MSSCCELLSLMFLYVPPTPVGLYSILPNYNGCRNNTILIFFLCCQRIMAVTIDLPR